MKKGITSNVLKIIAIMLMIIDHLGLYFYRDFYYDTYFILRSIGRIAMPIFAYLMVQGFFYTKSLKKYIFRIFILATITQIILLMLGYINVIYYPNYYLGANRYLGILYSYCISLILLTILDKKIIINKLNEKQNIIMRINIFILIIIAYIKLRIEFDWVIPFLFLEFYGIEKLFEKDNKLLLKQNLKTKKENIKKRLIYLVLILISILISTLFIEYSPGNKYLMLVSVLLIAAYTGDRGKSNKIVKSAFYLVFPLQHLILCLLAMLK